MEIDFKDKCGSTEQLGGAMVTAMNFHMAFSMRC